MPASAVARLALLLLAPLAASQAQVADLGPELLPQDEAFRVSAGATPAAFAFTVAIHEGYYLYRDRTALRLADGTTLALALPPGEVIEDEFFGRVATHRGELAFTAPRPPAGGAEQVAELVIQGCADAGVCYPPYAVSVAFAAAGPGELRGDNLGRYAAAPAPLSNTAALVAALDGSPLPLVLLLFFNAGLLLSFTPCVLPLVPLALAVSAGRGAGRRRALALGGAYVLSMAAVYAALGVLAATAGRTALAAWLQTPWLLVPLALLFAFLGIAMIAELRLRLLPTGLDRRLAGLRGAAGTWRGAAGAGVAGAVVVSPCVAAPLAGALLFIAATGEVATGGLALFALALGMGVLPLACAAGAGRFVPRAGPASVVVRRVGGLLLLGLGVWVLGGLLPAHVKMLAYAALALAACWWLGQLLRGGLASWPARGLAGAVLAAFLGFGGVMAVGGATGGTNELAPLAHLQERPPLAFSTVATLRAYNAGVRAEPGRPTLEYYTADWCVTCVEIDAYVFGDAEIQAELAAYRLVKIDVTESGREARRLLGINRLFGPPAVVVRSAGGAKLLQFAGTVDRDELLAGLRRIAARPRA